jgi:hypothetical protein
MKFGKFCAPQDAQVVSTFLILHTFFSPQEIGQAFSYLDLDPSSLWPFMEQRCNLQPLFSQDSPSKTKFFAFFYLKTGQFYSAQFPYSEVSIVQVSLGLHLGPIFVLIHLSYIFLPTKNNKISYKKVIYKILSCMLC